MVAITDVAITKAWLLTSLHILFLFQGQSTRRRALAGSSPRPLRIVPHFRDRACGQVCLGETLTPTGGKAPWQRL